MTVSSIDASKTLCELSGWQTSNLRLQKLLYIAHMYYMRGGKGDLVRENFEAWKFGPVERDCIITVKFTVLTLSATYFLKTAVWSTIVPGLKFWMKLSRPRKE